MRADRLQERDLLTSDTLESPMTMLGVHNKGILGYLTVLIMLLHMSWYVRVSITRFSNTVILLTTAYGPCC